MGNTFTIYANYGCLAAEKRTVYTAYEPHYTAVCSDKIMAAVPDGWKLAENYTGNTIIIAPWGDGYNINDLLYGNDMPYFRGYDDKSNYFSIKLNIL